MKKKLFLLVAVALSTAGASAQWSFPTAYQNMIPDVNNFELHHIWSDMVMGKPSQGLGLLNPGAKKIVTKIESEVYDFTPVWTYELYPNGLTKSDDATNGKHTYNYDKQWRLQSITDKDGKVAFRYIYDADKRLKQCIYEGGIHEEYAYEYDSKGALTAIKKGQNTYTIKDSCYVQYDFKDPDFETWPTKFVFDQKKRLKTFDSIVIDGMDEPIIVKTQITWNFGTGKFPTGITRRLGEFNPKKNIFIGKPEVKNCQYTFTYDSKGNWTSWKQTGGYPKFTITRTITYYTDEEVKAAVAEMEASRQAKKEPKEEKKEEMWEF